MSNCLRANLLERGSAAEFITHRFRQFLSLCCTYGFSAVSLAGANPPGVLEEVIVTAQKRAQNMQDVPVSITTLSGDMLAESAIKDVYDLQTNIPALRAFQSQNSNIASFDIRGIGTSAQNFGLESSVGVYVDGVYRARQNAVINNLYDMEAVEVLRGPQGTLFGRNTPSGAILFRTRAPSHETDAFIEATAGEYDLLGLSGATNLSPVHDILALRVAGFSMDRDGWVDVDGFGRDVLNDRDRWGIRLQGLYTPNDQFSARLIVDQNEIDETCCAALTIVDSIVAKQRVNPDGSPIPGTDSLLLALGGTVFTESQFDDYHTALNTLPQSKSEDKGISLEMNWHTGAYTFTSISSYRQFEPSDWIDADFSDVKMIEVSTDADQDYFSQEFRLTKVAEKLTYVLGAYYFKQDSQLDFQAATFPLFSPYLKAAYGLTPFIDGFDQISLLTGGLFPPAAEQLPAPYAARHRAKQDHEAWALFGQFDYNLSDELVLTAGLRYTKEKKDMTTHFYEQLNGQPVELGPAVSRQDIGAAAAGLTQLGASLAAGDPSLLFDPAFMAQFVPYQVPGWGYHLLAQTAPRPDIDVGFDDDQISGTLKLSWFINEDTMLYASYGTGYKSGGTNTDRIQAAFDPAFDAEKSATFEVGLKTEYPEHAFRLNAALHYTEVDDFQSNAFTGLDFNLQNAGKLESYGGELELFWYPIEGLEFDLLYAYIKAKFDQFEQGGCWVSYTFHTGLPDPGDSGLGICDRSGDRIPSAPEHTVTVILNKRFRLGDALSAFTLAEYTYTTDMVLDANNDPFKFQDDYWLLNLRAGLELVNYDASLILWARNVLDEAFRRTAFDVPAQDGKLNAYPGERRTWGVTLNKRF